MLFTWPLFVWTLLAVAALQAAAPATFAIKDVRVVTVSGASIERGTVMVRDGLIEAVGPNLAFPPEAWVIEAKGLTL